MKNIEGRQSRKKKVFFCSHTEKAVGIDRLVEASYR